MTREKKARRTRAGPALKVKDVMNPEVVVFREQDTLTLVNDVMSLARIRHFPVVDDRERPVGILSQRDLFRAALSHHLGQDSLKQRAHLSSLIVRDEMRSPVVTARPEESLADAVKRMIDKQVGALVIVEKGKLVGLLTETDLLGVLADLLEGG